MTVVSRRALIGAGLGAGALALAGCDRIAADPALRERLRLGESATYRWQRLIGGNTGLAREYGSAELSPVFKVNGSHTGSSPEWLAHAGTGFADWRLRVDGLVARPLDLSLAQLRAMPRRTQITRHDCVEGWSAIGEWSGVPLAAIMGAAGVRPQARYVVFHCADNLGGEVSKGGLQMPGQYYESIDMADVRHPQTILAYDMNRAPLSVGHGAPLRLRVERQLGYKQAKYLMRIEAVDSFSRYAGGRGGYWEDRGYEWYAGI